MRITVIYGSETGTAKGLAEETGSRLNTSGIDTEVIDMSDIRAANLANCEILLVLTSTWSDGEPPSNAWDLWGELSAKPNIDLSHVYYSVLGLGDSSYTEFCKCGQDFDQFLEDLGAKRIYPRKDCDVDYDDCFEEWFEGVKNSLTAIAV